MKLWMGHFYKNPKEWFVIWARTKDEAMNAVDCEWGEPDVRSMKQLHTPGGFCFKADFEEHENPDEDLVDITLHDDEYYFEEAMDLYDYILDKIKFPLGETSIRELSADGEHLGIEQAEVMKSYADKCPHCGEKAYFGPEKGCFQCGYNEHELRE